MQLSQETPQTHNRRPTAEVRQNVTAFSQQSMLLSIMLPVPRSESVRLSASLECGDLSPLWVYDLNLALIACQTLEKRR